MLSLCRQTNGQRLNNMPLIFRYGDINRRVLPVKEFHGNKAILLAILESKSGMKPNLKLLRDINESCVHEIYKKSLEKEDC